MNQTVEAGGKGSFVFTGQTKDEVGMDGGFGLINQEVECVEEGVEVGVASDSFGDIGVECLYADFEVECTGGEG